MFNEMLDKVRDLNLPPGEYAIFGSGPIVVRGIRPFRHDIDIIVSQRLWDRLSDDERFTLQTFERDGKTVEHLVLNDEKIELYHDWGPGDWDILELIESAETNQGLSFVDLNDVLKWKKISGRKKDLEDVTLIEKYFAQKQNG